jgi:hypothetical protein
MPATQRVHPQEWAELQAASPYGSAPLRDLLSSLLLLFFLWARPPAVPEVEAIAQLTDDGLAKGVHNSLQTDGRGSTSTKADGALRLIINRCCITRPAKRTQSSCDSVSMITNRKACTENWINVRRNVSEASDSQDGRGGSNSFDLPMFRFFDFPGLGHGVIFVVGFLS